MHHNIYIFSIYILYYLYYYYYTSYREPTQCFPDTSVFLPLHFPHYTKDRGSILAVLNLVPWLVDKGTTAQFEQDPYQHLPLTVAGPTVKASIAYSAASADKDKKKQCFLSSGGMERGEMR